MDEQTASSLAATALYQRIAWGMLLAFDLVRWKLGFA